MENDTNTPNTMNGEEVKKPMEGQENTEENTEENADKPSEEGS